MKLARTLLAAAAASAALASVANAADLLTPVPITDAPLFDFEGMYVGGTAGLAWGGSAAGTLGVVVGNNFALTDGIIAGVEFQGDAYFSGGGWSGYDALALGRIGGFASDNTMIYGELGVGLASGTPVYALGAGLEMAMTDQIGLRGEVQGLGAFGSTPSVGKATAGLIWHLD